MSEDRPLIARARRRYAPFVTGRSADLRITLALSDRNLRRHRDEPEVVEVGRIKRVERHDLDLELRPGRGRATVTALPTALDSLLRILLSFELIDRGGFLCHAAGVDAWLFPGRSGAGKSTLGQAAPKRRLLADELVGVAAGRLWGTPFRGDFLAGRNASSHPLEAIIFLNRFAPRGMHEVSKGAALARLLQCVLFFGQDSRTTEKILALVRGCVRRARTFALSYDARVTAFRGVETIIRRSLEE